MNEENGKQIPKGWAMTAIEDLFWPLEDGRTLHQGWSPQCEKTPAPTDEDWGVLKTTAIQAGAFLPEHNKHLPTGLTPRPQIEVKSGDLLITCAGPRVRCGVACLVRHTRPRLMMSGKMYRFRVSPDHFDPRFLEAFLLTPEATAAIDKMKTGGSDSGLNLTHDRFRPLPVPVAPLREQRRIMDTVEELLSDLDAGESALEGVRAKLKHYRAAVLKIAVEGTLTADWRAQNPATESAEDLLTRILAKRRNRWEEAQLKKFQDQSKEPPKSWKAKYQEPNSPDVASLPKLPDGWCWASLDQLGKLDRGKSKHRPRDAEFLYGGPYPFVQTGDVRKAKQYLRQHSQTYSQAGLQQSRLWPAETLCITIAANIAETALLAYPACFPDSIVGVQFPEELVLPRYVEFFMRHARQRIEAYAPATAQKNINNEILRVVAVPLPPTDEQRVIVEQVEDHLSVVDHLEADLEAKLRSARALRQSILRDAFKGKLVPQDPDDEPACKLLKRIAVEREERAKAMKGTKRPGSTKRGS